MTTPEPDGSKDHDPAPAAKPAAPKTRKQVTGVELEQRFEGWASRRRERREGRTPGDSARTFRRGTAVLMAGGIAALVIASGVTGENFGATRADNDARIADLKRQVTAAEAKPVDADTATKLTALTGAAAADANRVAAAQHAFAELYRKASLQPRAGNGAPSQAMLDVVEHRRTLAPLFSPKSYVADDTEAYRWSTADSFDAGTEIDPRYAWYVRYDGRTAADPGTYAWKLETVLPDLDPSSAAVPTDRAQVVWVCRDKATGQVLAWANGHYRHDGKTGLFDELEVVVTTAGAQHQLTAVTQGGRNGASR